MSASPVLKLLAGFVLATLLAPASYRALARKANA